MDITEEILSQHHEQRRLFALLEEIDPGDTDTLGALWGRLADFLEVHAAAEEEYFYPRLLELGKGSPGGDDPDEETKDAIKDHNEIRDGIAEAARHPVGSDGWWAGVRAANEANSDHMAEEERDDLTDFRLHVDLQTRHDIAAQFIAYEAKHLGKLPTGEAADEANKDPDEYVEEHSN